MAFTLTSQSSLNMTGSSVSQALNMTGSPNICYLNAGAISSLASPGGIQQTSEQANSIYYRVGSAALPVDATNGSLLKPGQGNSVAIPIVAGQPAFVSAIGSNGNSLAIELGVLS